MSDDLGLTPQAAVLAFGFGNPTPTTPAPTTHAPPAASLVEHHSDSGLSPEAVTMAGWIREDLAKGRMTQADADKAFDELGTPLDQRTTRADLRSPEQQLLDAHFPVARPEEFRIAYADPGQAAPPMTPELKQFDQSARTWLSQAEFPRDLGNSLITTISKVAQQTKHLNADQLESYGLVEYAKLERAYGGEDKLQQKLQQAAVMIHKLDKKTPGLKNLLKSKGIGDNALVVAQIIGQSERWHARRKGR